MSGTSFLAAVKAELDASFADAFDAITAVGGDADQVASGLMTLKKAIWTTVEKSLKQSYVNGKNAANGKTPPRSTEGPAAPPKNPFRKE